MIELTDKFKEDSKDVDIIIQYINYKIRLFELRKMYTPKEALSTIEKAERRLKNKLVLKILEFYSSVDQIKQLVNYYNYKTIQIPKNAALIDEQSQKIKINLNKLKQEWYKQLKSISGEQQNNYIKANYIKTMLEYNKSRSKRGPK